LKKKNAWLKIRYVLMAKVHNIILR
jgi:hypothetical protein